ncbi:MAG: hypothetical protein ACRDU9_07565 [Acidimicrobiia bacterium]
MTFTIRARRRAIYDCTHENTVQTEISGLSRSVCERCGHVSVKYVGNHLKSEQIEAFQTASSG